MTRSSRILGVALAGILSGCSPAQYFAQPASVAETRDTVRALKTQQDELVRRMEAIQKELEATTGRQAESNANLNAELGALTEMMESLSDRLNDLSGQIQRHPPRVAALPIEGGGAVSPDTSVVPPGETLPGEPPALPPATSGTATPTAPSATPEINPEEVYDAAYRDVSRGSYALAITGFQEFLRLFPDHALADNAQYWIGECYYVQNDPTRALEEFRKVLDVYPEGDKAPAAYLKLGYTALKLNNTNEARRYFDELIQKYPRSEEARTAREKLASLQ
jgi:tol-pal system protein YbgF